MCDDFDDSGDEFAISERSWQKQIDGISKDGYRTGIEIGQEESLQKGFDSAFTCSSDVLSSVAKLRGSISGKLTFNLMKPDFLSKDRQSKLESLLGDVVQLESDLLTFNNDAYCQLASQRASNDRRRSSKVGKSEDNTVSSACSSLTTSESQISVNSESPVGSVGNSNVNDNCASKCCQNSGNKCNRKESSMQSSSDGDNSLCSADGSNQETTSYGCLCNQPKAVGEVFNEGKISDVETEIFEDSGARDDRRVFGAPAESVESVVNVYTGSDDKLLGFVQKFNEIMSN